MEQKSTVLRDIKVKQISRRKFIALSSKGLLSIPFLSSSVQDLLADQNGNLALKWHSGVSSMINQSSINSSLNLINFLKQEKFSSVSVDRFDLNKTEKKGTENKTILILEGEFPEKNRRIIKELDQSLSSAKAVILVGNEAAYGNSSSQNFLDLKKYIHSEYDLPSVALPGHPLNLSHFLTTINYLLLYGIPDLDEYRRPKMLFGDVVCDSCEYRKDLEQGNFRESFLSDNGCLYKLGCKGPFTKNTCAKLKWNSSSEWCVSVGSPCSGCSEPNFPFHQGDGIYGQSQNESLFRSNWIHKLDEILLGSSILSVGGVAAHSLSQKAPNYLESDQINRFYQVDDENQIPKFEIGDKIQK